MTSDQANRRRKKRYGVKGSTIQYRKGGLLSFLGASSAKCIVINISEFGLAFVTKGELRPADKIALSIDAPKLAEPIAVNGRVLWVKKADDINAYKVGVEFNKLAGRVKSNLKSLLDNALLDSVDISTRYITIN
ncbi:MAG: hypothetical protein A2W23_02220 [Planctomycetes bacterium RBG_16_43_13]|nr:MAG: hypothetical protein A2W23_02220 [Planctomycetes bacterium RBG_16_43_13]